MMGRRLILCLDGTDNSPTSMAKDPQGNLEPVRTNVSRFFRMLDKSQTAQLAYYQPGVGTIDPERSSNRWDRMRNQMGRIYDSMVGWMISTHVMSAYRFLMNQYQPGDEIYLLGFSRGAFVARVVAGMLHKVGLLYPGQEETLPFAYQVYAPLENHDGANRFRQFYSRTVPIRFLGLWDTVSSVGNPFHMTVFPYTQNNPSVQTVRHAMALDERRVMFRQNLWGDHPASGQNVLQVWFPGVHADIGGGYTGDSSPGLAGIPLAWMIREARTALVQFDAAEEQRLLWPQSVTPPPVLSVEAVTDQYVTAEQHDEIRDHWHWRLVEQIPLPRSRMVGEHEWKREFSRHRSAPRKLVSNQKTTQTIRVHHSVDLRCQRCPQTYNPENLVPATVISRVW
ncbi:MAG: DUF2235 domain-containing protein [Planctomycetes bacterium]|nr:DUF2235 domain-containing protein [Planctomycetota bacterium]